MLSSRRHPDLYPPTLDHLDQAVGLYERGTLDTAALLDYTCACLDVFTPGTLGYESAWGIYLQLMRPDGRARA